MTKKLELLSRELREDASYEDGYSTFMNKDEDLLKSILSFTKPTSFKYLNTIWEIESYDGDSVRCTHERDIKYFSKKDVEEYVEEERRNKLSLLYHEETEFANQFFPMFKLYEKTTSGRNTWYQLHLDELYGKKRIDLPLGWDNSRLLQGFEKNSYSILDAYDELEFEYNSYGSMCFMHYDKNGNFVNRDYNIKLQDYVQGEAPVAKIYTTLLELLLKFGSVECKKNATNTFFTQTHCLKAYLIDELQESKKLRFVVSKIPRRENGTYREDKRGATVIKRPENLITLSPEEFLEIMEKNFLSKIRASIPNFNNL